ncbi:MAG: hypothetical protein OHK0029_20640 [Armatimonadaceae bacterium]
MAALTQNYEADEKRGEIVAYAVGQNKDIFKGALVVMDDTGGYAEPGTDATGKTFLGVAYERADNNPGSAGAVTVRVRKTGSYVYNFSGTWGQAAVGKKAYIVDDNTVALAATTTNDVNCGDIVGLEGTGKVRVRIDRAAG